MLTQQNNLGNNMKAFIMTVVAVPVVAVLVAPAIIGWSFNLYLLSGCDFASPYKAEVIRTVGVFIPPVGAITGYFYISGCTIPEES